MSEGVRGESVAGEVGPESQTPAGPCRRRAIAVPVAASLLALAAGLWWFLAGAQVNTGPAAYGRIRLGMTRAEAEAVFGGPAGDYTEGAVFYRKGDPGARGESRPGAALGQSECWVTSRGCITLTFDGEGRVADKHFTPTYPSRRDWLARLRAILGI